MKVLHVGYGYWPYRYGGLMNYVEDLMDAQVGAGDQVTYFCAGRHYPLLRDDRLHRWTRRGIAMREILNSSMIIGGPGTLYPETDLHHPPSERHFWNVLEETSPAVVHIQEIVGLPSAIIDLTKAAGIPVIETLQDYGVLCPVHTLYDVDHQRCLRRDVGGQCARCSAGAPENRRRLFGKTGAYELRRQLPGSAGDRVVATALRTGQAIREVRSRRDESAPAAEPPLDRDAPAAQDERARAALRYQARRDVNVDRLSRVDLLVAQSHCVKEIYSQLGVPESRLRVMQLTLSHLARMRPRAMLHPPERIRFVTLNGCASVPKGSEVVLGALEQLQAAGLGDRFEFTALGHASPETQRRLADLPSAWYGGGYDVSTLDEKLAPFDVGIVPSIWEEAYGYVGVELLAKGIPVIGNGRGGIVDYVREGKTGWLNADCTGKGLAAIMSRLISNPSEVFEMHRQIVADRGALIRTMPDHAGEVRDVYETVIRSNQRRAVGLTT